MTLTRLARPATLAAGATLAAAVATFLVAAPARADGIYDTESVVVHFGDLDVNTPNGAQLLYMRLRNAAKSVCGDEYDAIDLKERGIILACQRGAIEHAVEYVDRPLLTALYDRHNPQQQAIVSASMSGAARG